MKWFVRHVKAIKKRSFDEAGNRITLSFYDYAFYPDGISGIMHSPTKEPENEQ